MTVALKLLMVKMEGKEEGMVWKKNTLVRYFPQENYLYA